MKYPLMRLAVTIVFFGALPAVLIFVLAGRWDLWNVWAFAGILVVWFSFQGLAASRASFGLLKERINPATRGRDVALRIGGLVMLVLPWSIAGLDQRFHWSDIVPLAGVVAGLVICAIGLGLYAWSLLVNPFFILATRIQADRGQRVISAGPYAIVRHPGYAGSLLIVVAGGLALNSLLSIIAAVIVMAAFLPRLTAAEDRMLHDELAGYADYAAKVRYRLLPGIW
jgi:protein-S-isoprenylcysteine O-methyltransferase Ste14